MSKNYVYSTLSNDQTYQNWAIGEGGLPNAGHSVFVKGGHGVANDRLITPLGVMTEVSDYDIEQLEHNPVFQLHKANGFVVVRQSKADTEKVASDMQASDLSAPLTEADIETKAKKAQ
jgi:hypothetical protein